MHLLKVGLLMIQDLAMHVSEGLRCLKCRKSYFIVGTPKYSLSLRSEDTINREKPWAKLE